MGCITLTGKLNMALASQAALRPLWSNSPYLSARSTGHAVKLRWAAPHRLTTLPPISSAATACQTSRSLRNLSVYLGRPAATNQLANLLYWPAFPYFAPFRPRSAQGSLLRVRSVCRRRCSLCGVSSRSCSVQRWAPWSSSMCTRATCASRWSRSACRRRLSSPGRPSCATTGRRCALPQGLA